MKIQSPECENYPPERVQIMFHNCKAPDGLKTCIIPNNPAMIQDVQSVLLAGHRKLHKETGTQMCKTNFSVLQLEIGKQN